MQDQVNIGEKINIGVRGRARDSVGEKARLNVGEKLLFGVAATFSSVILVICLALTMIGFIFSPLTETLLFAFLTGAAGLTTYVIWRGGTR